MSLETTTTLLGWCLTINVGLLGIWFLAFWLVRDFVYQLHTRIFKISPGTFDAIHYAGMAIYKILIMLLNLTPYLALQLMKSSI